MPKLKSPSKTYPKMFPAGYSGSQVLRSALKDGPEQRLYTSGDSGLGGHKNLGTYINGFAVYHGQGSLYSSISGHNPANLSAAVSAVRCQSLSPKKYFVGYEDGRPKYIEGRQEFRCVDFLSGYIKSIKSTTRDLPAAIKTSFSSYENLNSYIIAGKEIFSGYKDLNSILTGGVSFAGSLSADINGVYCHTLTPKKYFVGYEAGIPKFIDGRPRYRCVDFLSGSIQQVYYRDLSGFLYAVPRENRDLSAYLKAILKQEDYNLRVSIKGWGFGQYDLSAYIKGVVYRDLGAFLRSLTHEDLTANLYIIPPKDLSAYLKVWPMESLPARLHGWQTSDLGAVIDWNMKRDLRSYIGTSFPVDLSARMKGWARGVISDLTASFTALLYEDLTAFVRSNYLRDLPAYLFVVEAENLTASLYGWQEYDLSADLLGVYGPHDLRAYINASGGKKDLPGYLKPRAGTRLPTDLPAQIFSSYINDLSAYLKSIEPVDLSAYINTVGSSDNLTASIFPKMVYMTALVSIGTMEHLDLSATINFICNRSGYKDLMSYIRCTYLDDLSASITGYKTPTYTADLAAKIGYADSMVYTEKLPISVSIGSGYLVEDKLPISLSIYKQQALLSAYINGTYMHNSLGASITPVWLQDYEFDNYKSREIVYDLDHYQRVNWYEIVEMYFKSMVTDYFYVGGEKTVYKTDRSERWMLELSSYVPENTALNIRRKLHRVREVYDLDDFNSLDEAIRAAIDYVTSYDYSDLSVSISGS